MTTKNGRHPVEVVAQVKSMELNLDYSGVYKLELKDGSAVSADFTAWQWTILQSLHNGGEYPLQIIGEGNFADGLLERIVSIDLKHTQRVLPPEDPEMPTIWHIISEISKSADWSGVPTDGSQNLNHYLYGWPKVGE